MFFVDRTAAVLKPTERFLQWLNDSQEDMPDLTLPQLRANCSVFGDFQGGTGRLDAGRIHLSGRHGTGSVLAVF